MSQVSRPMQIAMAATLLFFAVWFVALRPKPTTESEAPTPAPAPAVQPSSSGAAPAGAETVRERATSPTADDGPSAHISRKPIHTRGSVASVRAALRMHKAIAIAFVDSATADSRAVDRELLHVSRFGGRAFTLSVPLADVSDYAFITNSVEVTVAPTVVIVDPRRHATTIVGAADRVEIEQRLADALKAKPQR
jgi:hypothetical protein